MEFILLEKLQVSVFGGPQSCLHAVQDDARLIDSAEHLGEGLGPADFAIHGDAYPPRIQPLRRNHRQCREHPCQLPQVFFRTFQIQKEAVPPQPPLHLRDRAAENHSPLMHDPHMGAHLVNVCQDVRRHEDRSFPSQLPNQIEGESPGGRVKARRWLVPQEQERVPHERSSNPQARRLAGGKGGDSLVRDPQQSHCPQ
ncbi:MAG: hypothetical protein KatS3mg112_0312 [Thermogutta sp.]|nr:MAG: hypothetical protein KatS3mg112_0312 [Thermogutta sp.]